MNDDLESYLERFFSSSLGFEPGSQGEDEVVAEIIKAVQGRLDGLDIDDLRPWIEAIQDALSRVASALLFVSSQHAKLRTEFDLLRVAHEAHLARDDDHSIPRTRRP